jgi:hypothetical protein
MKWKIAIVGALMAVSPAVSSAQAPVTVASTAPFLDEGLIQKNVLAECKLPERMIELLIEQATAAGITVVKDDDAAKAGKGRVLVLQIVSASASGNAFMGKKELVSVKGRLTQDGADVGNFSATRTSGGGAFGGYKGACAILGRCMQTLGSDISKWLKNPSKDARLGENK